MIKIQLVRKVDKEDLRAVNDLLDQLSPGSYFLRPKEYRYLLSGKDYFLLAARDGKRIIGMGSLILTNTTAGLRSRFEDVVVDEKYRGRGIGKKISLMLIAIARKKRATLVDLTSGKKRKSAHKLYEKLGFKERDTKVYRLDFRK
jgi:ribosomal protein S18 acetylase RimI-like enzyme